MMSAAVDLYCEGYALTRIVEACRKHGLFAALDANTFQREALIEALRANAGCFTLALEALASSGVLESSDAGAYRRADRVESDFVDLDFSSLYRIDPRNLIREMEHAQAVARMIEALLDPARTQSARATQWAWGSILVPLCCALAPLNGDRFHEELSQLDASLARAIERLFLQREWLSAEDGRLTDAGRALLQASAFSSTVAYRPVLDSIEDLLFGDPDAVRMGSDIDVRVERATDALSDGRVSDDRPPTIVVSIDSDSSAIEQLTRALRAPSEAKQDLESGLSVLAAEHPAHYLDKDGELLGAQDILSRWRRQLQILAEHVGNVPIRLRASHDTDVPILLSRQHPIRAEALIILAASVGLFNEEPPKRYPKLSPVCRSSLHCFRRRDYRVRYATENDLERLCELEKLCWRHTRASRQRIRARLREYPQGHFVLEKDGEVLGVIYSQRIAAPEALETSNAATVHQLHQPSGSIVQLLAVNIDPQVQNHGYGDQLLEFMLQRCTLVTGVTQVVGVTLCKSYDARADQSFEEYIQQRGEMQDPVLAFHQSHGARIVKALPSYRPQDRANRGNGVLVSYDILNRAPLQAATKAAPVGIGPQEVSPQEIKQFVEERVIQLSGVERNAFQVDRPLMELGLDSADLLKLQQQLEAKLKRKLAAGFFFEHNNTKKVIASLAGPAAAAPPTGVAAPAPSSDRPRLMKQNPESSTTDIAIVGLACKLPGGIETPEQFWRVLASGTSVIGSYPASRGWWPAGAELPAIDRGGFIQDADAFDAGFFRISPAEAAIMDPQQRLLLELAWTCLEHAAIPASMLQGSNTGVFIGASNCDYSRLLQQAGLEVQAHHGVASSLAILANRLSYFFDLSGPSLLIDTACSSSLVALHTAMQSLRSGECAAAMVGGVNVICHPDLSVAYHKAGMLAPDGECKVFDARANGYVRSEGAVMMLLKPLSAAIAARNRIHAVLKGSAINHGGLAGGLTVPNPKKQSDLLVAAWQNADIRPQALTYIEAHGTGTSLGDPIEMQGIQAAGRDIAGCTIGSVKSNLGHLEPAAGLAGLLKIVLSMQHGQIPPSVNFSQLNPKIWLDGTPFRIAQQLGSWDAAGPRLAAVSSFGSGGANAHVVVEDYPRSESVVNEAGPFLFVLSAANEERLRVYAQRVIEWLEGDGARVAFADAIYTWQVGRSALKQRLALRVGDAVDLRNRLQQWLSGHPHLTDAWSGSASADAGGMSRIWQAQSGQQLIAQALHDRDLEQLGILWTSGAQIDWRELHAGAGADRGLPQPVSVPTYPFAREHYWIDSRGNDAPEARAVAAAVLHPLVHVNTSDLRQQSYRSTFTGREFFLADHRVNLTELGYQRVLPGVAFLEMARVAIEQALPDRPEGSVLELRDIVWIQPLIVAETQHVSIALSQDVDEQIDFEICSRDDTEIIHCQGRAAFISSASAVQVEIEPLKRLMLHGTLDAGRVYSDLSAMGLAYGPAHRSITAVHQGEHQLVAALRLPTMLEPQREAYALHPSLMDGALQAAIGLIEGWTAAPKQPRLPFALESLRIISKCSPEMLAWVRYTAGSQPADRVIRLNIDLCDEHGNVCAQMRGFAPQVPNARTERAEVVLATPVWQREPSANGAPVEMTQHHILVGGLSEVDIQALQRDVPGSHCSRLQSSPHKTLADRYGEAACGCFETLQRILQDRPRGKVLIQVVLAHRQEQAVFAGLTGLLKTAALENPELFGQIILVDPHATVGALAGRLREDRCRTDQALIKYEADRRYVLGWQTVSAQQSALEIAFKDHGVYLVTGGLGALGLLFAREILAQASRARVILTGRSTLNDAKEALLHTLAAQPGQHVEYRTLDPSDLDQVRHAVAAIEKEHGALNGILHCAGMVADDFILKKSAAALSRVLAPKVTGTFNLDQATANTELDFLVLFSSIASVTGNLGQADYAVANGFMDQFAAYRNEQVAAGHRCGRTLAINWPYWIDGGMRLDPARQTQLRETTGMRPLPTAMGLRAFYQSLALSADQCWVMAGDPPAQRPPVSPTVSRTLTGEADAVSLLPQTQDYLRKELSALLKLPAHKIEPRTAMDAYGIDSILAVNLVRQLERTFGPLPKTLFFEYRTLHELAQYFIQTHPARLAALVGSAGQVTLSAPVAVAPAQTRRRNPERRISSTLRAPANAEPIAIIGLSGRYPEAENLEAYWRNLRDGKDCIVEVPRERWDWRAFFSEDRTASGRHYSKWGGFIAGVDEFDPMFFNIAPRDAKFIDPQERLFLQHAWMAVEDAGYTRASLQVPEEQDLAGQVGVYVGVMWSEYQLYGAESGAQDLRMGFAGNLASIANRVSYVLNLHGPSMTLDTMCSSSLTAIHVACQDLRQGRTRLAIAGGVNVSIHPSKYLLLSVGQFISSDGHCQSFGEGGDGYIPGEGVGVVVLKRLAEAERDGDHIYGIIRGSALNHGGRTNGYTVPNPQAQASAISRTLAESRIDARQISYVEAHGTGTKLGDPIEIAALARAFQQHTAEKGFCLIGSAKSNIGHCESAAGIAGLTKVLLQMQHGQIVPSLHSAQLNPHIDFSQTPFVVNQSLRPWEPPLIEGQARSRVAGISSFGAGGSNAHMIVEEHVAPLPPIARDVTVVIPLSARTAEQLQQKARDLLSYLRARASEDIDLMSMAYTLQVGREPMDERLGLIVSSAAELTGKLQAYVAGEQSIENLFQGQVKRNRDVLSSFITDADWQQTLEKWIAQRKLAKLLDLWVKGLELDWNGLYGEMKPRRVSLPTYPFGKDRHWIDRAPREPASAMNRAVGMLHPLLHANTSDLMRHRYTSTFTGDELFLRAHQGVLPNVLCLEMARAAIEQSHAARPEASILELRELSWAQPIVITGAKQLHLALLAEDGERLAFEIYSDDTGDEVIHCQGRAAFSVQPAPARLDLQSLRDQMSRTALDASFGPAHQTLTAIYQGANQRLAKLHLSAAEEKEQNDFALPPGLLDGALQAAIGLVAGWSEMLKPSPQPFALDLLRLVWPCATDVVAWIRHAADDRLDIDLCDEAGNVCVQMRGMRYAHVIEPAALPAMTSPDVVPPPPVLTDLAFIPSERKKPTGIALASLTELVMDNAAPLRRAPIALASVTVDAPSSVRCEAVGEGTFLIRLPAANAGAVLSKELTHELMRVLSAVQRREVAKVLILSGGDRTFLRGGRPEVNDALQQQLFQTLASFPYPVIAALQGDATGPGFLMSALCDFMVCAEEALFGYTDLQSGLFPSPAEAALFTERLGAACAQDFLYVETKLTGQQLREKGWACPIVPRAEVESHALNLAATLATKSHTALRLLKQHLARHMRGLAATLSAVEPSIDVQNHADDVACMQISADAPLEELIAASKHSIVVLEFREGAEETLTESRATALQRFVLGSPLPVIAVLSSNAHGLAWLISQYCDACIYNEAGSYAFVCAESGAERAHEAALLFSHRFGSALGKEIVLTGAEYSGAELQRRLGALAVAAPGEVVQSGLKLAASWGASSRGVLLAWKQHTSANLEGRLNALRDAPADSESPDVPTAVVDAPTTIALQSHVITASAHPSGILVVRMEDRQAKNMFSEAFVAGIREVFAHIEATPVYKAVVLTGYDSYFASGGTRESLLAIQRGEVKFTHFDIFQLPMECAVPVIAAVQGHGIGAGWAFGMFADFVLLSEESRYVSPYMDYGFTPGAGATLILPQQLGYDVASESLLTARQYSGAELERRGVSLPVLPRSEVLPAAMKLAQAIVRMPRSRIVSLKHRLTGPLRASVADTYQLELAMHEQTFVGRSDTLKQIRSQFLDVMGGAQDALVGAPVEAPSVPTPLIDGDALSAVTATLRTLLAQELHLQEADIDEGVQFVDLGLDSIIAVTWIRKINERYRLSLEATKVYAFSTLGELSRYVRDEAQKQGTLPAQAAAPAIETSTHRSSAPARPNLQPDARQAKNLDIRAPSLSPSTGTRLTSWRHRAAVGRAAEARAVRSAQPIAVIGMAGQFPQARSVEEFWRNIAEGRDCITAVPVKRWSIDAYYQPGAAVTGKTNSRWMGCLEEYDLFDPLFFNISPTEAASMDPQQRLFLQTCWHSIEHAGYDAKSLSGSRCGVFVGCADGDYHHLAPERRLTAQGFTGSANSILAGRVAYVLDLQGPCLSIDTACSSSLVALAHACDSLIAGDSDLALAGGVAVMATPEMHIKTAQAGMLSPDGRCFTFDQRANGFVPGEAVGVVLLKRLADAQRDGDIIHGVIEGWGVNQDGKTNGITAPNPRSQTRLQQYVYDKYRIDPADIQLIEAHGTGTRLGDPIEVEGLKDAFGKYTQKTNFCALGSVKSNIGHCLAAAGIAGFIKIILALGHRQLPPTLHFERLNEHIALAKSPFYVNDRLRDWPREPGKSRRAAISSFGFSGTNVHLVAAEYAPPSDAKPPVSLITQGSDVIVPLSARTSEQLEQKAHDLLAFMRRAGASLDLIELAYTLQVGREAMEERVGFLAGSLGQLTERLQAYVDGARPVDGVYRGQVGRSKERMSLLSEDVEARETLLERWIGGGRVAKLLDLWVNGLALDWNRLYGEVKPQRICLPLYPFAKERHWLEHVPSPSVFAQSGSAITSASIHPLLHTNTSDFNEQRYRSLFSGEEFFLSDHRIRMGGVLQKVLPGVAYLEMARAAMEQAMPAGSESALLELRDTVWLTPVIVVEPTAVSITLFGDEADELSIDDESITYEIFTETKQRKTLHCEGRAALRLRSPPTQLDIAQLRARMTCGRMDAAELYASFARLGHDYGPAHQGIVAIERGEDQLLASLRLPPIIEPTRGDYVLHPCLMDSALQASIGLIDGLSERAGPIVPFALESLCIVSACGAEAFAWVRRSLGSRSADAITRVDIDVFAPDGNICIEMRGFAMRTIVVADEAAPFDSTRYQTIIENILKQEISVDKAVELG